jgi:glycosyltransferase involved in cell wall biosynthesis
VSYHGHDDHADLDEIAATADFCIIPSLCDETLGFTGLEMLARGVPLIVSDRAGASEFIESGVNGFLFDPASAEELLQIIRQLHHDTTLVKYVQSPGRNCTKKIESFSEHVTEMEALFSSTIFSEKSKR